MSFRTIATTPSVFTDWETSSKMSYLYMNPLDEVRLICLRRFRQGEGYTPWKVANSPGILISEFQYPRRPPREVLDMGPDVDDVVNCLTDLIHDGQFQASIGSRTAADNAIQWTEWQLGAISHISVEPIFSRAHSATVKAMIVRQRINVPDGHSEAHHQRRSRSADDVRRRRYDADGSDGGYA